MTRSPGPPLAGLAAILLAATAPAQSTRPASCASAEHRQFDFWVGDWDAYDAGKRDSVVARLQVDLILDGCVLREVYEGRNGLVGQSFSSYDAPRRVWHQSWVTNRGQLLLLEGRLEGAAMVLSGAYPQTPGVPAQIRGIWKRVEDGVRETAETSEDGGKTWKPLFDLIFRKHVP
jgi:hypothetical protein